MMSQGRMHSCKVLPSNRVIWGSTRSLPPLKVCASSSQQRGNQIMSSWLSCDLMLPICGKLSNQAQILQLTSPHGTLASLRSRRRGPCTRTRDSETSLPAGLVRLLTLLLLLRLHSDELSDVQSSDEAVELLDRILSAIDPKRNIQPDDQCYSILLLGLLQNPGFEATSVIERQDAMAFDRTLPADEAEENSPAQQPRPLPTPNQVREAQLLYDHARSIGIPPTASLVTPLLNAYCDAFLPSLPSAMSLVQDMLDYRSRSNNARKAPGAPRRKISSSSTAQSQLGSTSSNPF